MNRYLIALLLLVVAALPWAMVAFANWSWSPAGWDTGSRIVVVVLYLVSIYALSLSLLCREFRRGEP
jgi:hypothetical protein